MSVAKLLFVCNEYPPALHGGIGTFVKTLARELVGLGQQVVVCGFDAYANSDRKEYDQGVLVYRFHDPFQSYVRPRFGKYTLDLYDSLRRNHLSKKVDKIVDSEETDLIESYDWSGPLGKKPSRPLIIRLHGANFVYSFYEKRKASLPLKLKEIRNIMMGDQHLAVSRHVGDITIQAMERKFKYEVVYNGIDVNKFSPGIEANDPNEVLYVGAISHRKGIFHFLRSIPHIIDHCPAAHFKFVGKMSEREREMIFRETAAWPIETRNKLNWIQHVPQTDLPDIYRHASVVVFPSLAEAFGLTCVEAMACGKPVVVTSLASGPELIQNGCSGLLADPRNPTEFAAAVRHLIDDPELSKEMGIASRERVVTHFNLHDLAARNLSYYRSLLS